MAIDPRLVSIKTASDLTTGIPTDAGFFFYWEGSELKKAPMSDMYDKLQSGIKGVATAVNSPTVWNLGDPYLFERYSVDQFGVKTNFKDASNNPIEVTAADLDGNLVEIWVENGVARKVVMPLPKGDDGLNATANIPAYGSIVFPITYPSMYTYGDRLYQVKSGQILQSTNNPEDATKVQLIKGGNVTYQNIDPSQIVPTEALYQDDTLAGDILKRVDKATNLDVNYQLTNIWKDGSAMSESKVDGVVYIKRGNNYYVDANFVVNKEIRLSQYIPTDGELHTIASIFPTVTLAEVQAFDAGATLSSSAAWYIITKLLSWVPKYTNIDIDCDIKIDRTIVIKRGFFKMISSGLRITRLNTNPYIGRRPSILQIGTDQDIFKFIDGDGTVHTIGYVQEVWMKGFDITHNDYTGDGISFNYVNGTLISLWIDNVTIAKCKYGIKKYTGHINNIFFTNVVAKGCFNLGMDFPSANEGQTNYVVLNNCAADVNGLTKSGTTYVSYEQVEGSYNYEKGGLRIAGTAIYIYNFLAQVNNGLGMNFPNYIFGGLVTGYAEQNKIGDVGTVQLNPDSFINFQVVVYSNNSRYYIPNEIVRHKIDPQFSAQKNKEYALKSYSKNLISNPLSPGDRNGWSSGRIEKIINSDGIGEVNFIYPTGVTYFYPVVNGYDIPKKNDVFSISFEVNSPDYLNINFALDLNATQTWLVQNVANIAGKSNEWIRVSLIAHCNADLTNNLFYIRKLSGAQPFKVRNLSLRKLLNPEEKGFQYEMTAMPVQANSTATDVAGVVADLNALISKMKANNLMAPGV